MAALDELEKARAARVTHVFQRLDPPNPHVRSVCARCGLALPHGLLICFVGGQTWLPDCEGPPSYGHNG